MLAPTFATTAAAPLATDAGLLVALGAIPGAWLRFRLVHHLAPRLPRRHWGTVVVNGSACLLLGLLVSLERGAGAGSQRLWLLLGTGFLGSYSTFSTFIAEWHAALRQGEWPQAGLLLVASLLIGLAGIGLGLWIGGGLWMGGGR